MTQLTDDALNVLFREARTHNGWQNKPVAEEMLVALWDLVKMAPTSANCLPARIVFVTSDEGRERLKPHLMEGNVAKTMAAPVTAIIGFDMEFYNHLPDLFPHADAKSWFVGNDQLIYDTAFRNSTLQGGYLIMAARALGLNCGPMSGFNPEGVTKEFFPGTSVKVNFLCNIGYGNDENLFPRSPRPDFEKFCSIV
ncbi:malonic semialdehyde reductase [Magnetovibrio blakemorei]|uniref:Putative NADH dehydrogenase/NAD(P)H nitroreductase BEN30_16740 n=1 Tax=Magnetovibrio blakemorei TaxID=28181 RepID=A0A1E5Q3Q7_9PROT|nr:malonic semialdehyde reductase [Magnetovibrio blakemorei]OEJ64326.1 malonic semialdehyde reductase [Magnetovibrio blakemorei]